MIKCTLYSQFTFQCQTHDQTHKHMSHRRSHRAEDTSILGRDAEKPAG